MKLLSRLGFLAMLSILSLAASMFYGAAEMNVSHILQCLSGECQTELQQLIFWEVRFPRVMMGFVAGMGLAMAGGILQNTTRNVLAEPYLFGIMSGAGLGASIATLLFNSRFSQEWGLETIGFSVTLPVAAFLGALLSIFLVLALTRGTVWRKAEQMLLAGVAISFMLSAVSQFLLFLAEPFATNKVIFWLMGSLARVEGWHLTVIVPVVLGSLLLMLIFARHLDAMLLGDESAKSLGVNVDALRYMSLAACAALTASIVAYCGGIGFVGLMIPHIVRRYIGVTTRGLIVGSALLGGSFLVWVDVVARSALQDQEIPIGIITSAIGSVFFLIVMTQGVKGSR